MFSYGKRLELDCERKGKGGASTKAKRWGGKTFEKPDSTFAATEGEKSIICR